MALAWWELPMMFTSGMLAGFAATQTARIAVFRYKCSRRRTVSATLLPRPLRETFEPPVPTPASASPYAPKRRQAWRKTYEECLDEAVGKSLVRAQQERQFADPAVRPEPGPIGPSTQSLMPSIDWGSR